MLFRRRAAAPPPDPVAAQIDVGALPAGRRGPVLDALAARHRYGELVAGVPEGPLRDRLTTMGERVDAGVLAVWKTTEHAQRIDALMASLDPERATAELKQARRDVDAGHGDPAALATLTERFASTQRLLNARVELDRRIPLLEARLATAVARAAELTLTSSASTASAGLDTLGGELDALVIELQALQGGVDDVGGRDER